MTSPGVTPRRAPVLPLTLAWVLSTRIDLEGTHFRPNTRRQLSSATGHGHHPRDREADTDRKGEKKRARRILTYASGLSPPSRLAESPGLPLFRPCAGTNGNYFSAIVDDWRILFESPRGSSDSMIARLVVPSVSCQFRRLACVDASKTRSKSLDAFWEQEQERRISGIGSDEADNIVCFVR